MRIDLSTPTTSAFAQQVTTKSLGDHSYIVVVGDEAVAIDIQRDLDRFENVLDGIDASLVGVFETHIHNDYVSGGLRLAEAHDAAYVLPANTGAPYGHTPLADGESFSVGGWRVVAMHTPGHTFNHTSYVLQSPSGPVAIFSGGSMLVGAVGRSDLLGADHTDELLDLQYHSVHRIADELADASVVAPTHGSGSFCSASSVADSTSTIDLERQRNPALLSPNAEVFGAAQKAGYKVYPAYYAHMAPANLQPLGAAETSPLAKVTALASVDGASVIDVRDFARYATGHVPGSISVPLSKDTAVYIGWVLPWNTSLILVGSSEDVDETRLQLSRIGWDDVIGWIDPMNLSQVIDEPLATTRVMAWDEYDDSVGPVVDVRDPVEQQAGVLPGATMVHFADFVKQPGTFVESEAVIHCESGYRAAVAAGFAEAAGAEVTVIRDQLSKAQELLTARP